MSNQEDFQTEVLTQLGDIKALCATSAAHHEAITQRVDKIEEQQTHQWWFSVAIAPTLALLHAGARKLGINV